jgi:hypothetical protein
MYQYINASLYIISQYHNISAVQNTVLVCRESRRQALKGLERIARESMIAWSMGIGLHIGMCVCISVVLAHFHYHFLFLISYYLSIHLIIYL